VYFAILAMGKKKVKNNDPFGGEKVEDIEFWTTSSDYDNFDVTVEGEVANEEDFKRVVESSDTTQQSEENGNWPPDCYTFLALHGPLENPVFFLFGFTVWAFQMVFLILLVLRVASKKLSTNEDTDNPDSDFFSSFIPSNVDDLSRATQYMALLSYCIFADESVKDIVTAVEMWPKIKKVKKEDNIQRIMLSCTMRFSQGILASLVVLLLVISTQDVIDIILNFTAVNFISGFDDVAFELAQWGKYGPVLEAEAKRIENLPAPPCIFRKYQHIRYFWTILPIALVLISLVSTVTYSQTSTKLWLTTRLRVQFEDGTNFENYSGCYILNRNSVMNRLTDKRVVYDGYYENPTSAKFGYCRDNRKWYLYTGDNLSACDIPPKNKIAYSEKTYSFDIASSFDGGWVSQSGTPLEVYFFEKEEELDDKQCSAFLGDGICNPNFNVADYNFDSGDCCAATCDETRCGYGTMKKLFDTDVANAYGYEDCKDPAMMPITIYLNRVFREETVFRQDTTFVDAEPRDPIMILDCEGSVLMLFVDVVMMNKAETVMIADGASCSMKIKNVTSRDTPIWFVDYTIYHGNKSDIETDPIVIATGNSFEKEVTTFRRIPACFLNKLSDHVNRTTIYTGTGPSKHAVQWLLEDSLGYSNCELTNFIERYALATINFAAPLVDTTEEADPSTSLNQENLWINKERQCAWRVVVCDINGNVSGLNLGDAAIIGTMATEIGILKSLTKIQLRGGALYGTIPPEIRELKNLEKFDIGQNFMTGTIPSGIAQLTNLQWLFISSNDFTGTIPSILGKMSSISRIEMYSNNFTSTLPDEIGSMSNLQYALFSDNLLTGTIPSVYGDLQNLNVFDISYNGINGTIPSELGRLKDLATIKLEYNKLTGSIPEELLYINENLTAFNDYANQLSGLIPIEGGVICSAEGGEHYCNCKDNCVSSPNRCGCQEAQSCCASFLEQFTKCIVCENSSLQNPDLYLRAYDLNCTIVAWVIENWILDFGTYEKCEEAKFEFKNAGCLCVGEDSTANGTTTDAYELEV